MWLLCFYYLFLVIVKIAAQNPCEPNPCGPNTRCLTQAGSSRPVISCKCLPGNSFRNCTNSFLTARTYVIAVLEMTLLVFVMSTLVSKDAEDGA